MLPARVPLVLHSAHHGLTRNDRRPDMGAAQVANFLRGRNDPERTSLPAGIGTSFVYRKRFPRRVDSRRSNEAPPVGTSWPTAAVSCMVAHRIISLPPGEPICQNWPEAERLSPRPEKHSADRHERIKRKLHLCNN